MILAIRPGRLIPVLVALVFAGCAASPRPQLVPNPVHATTLANSSRKLIVFLDGTSNEWRARTNVRRFFELAAAQEDPRRLCFWMEGVGTDSLVGKILGKGMRPRIMAAYDFLARNHREGDEIYVFGYSRGAFQARALCGMLAHCGLYAMETKASDRYARRDEPIPLDKIWKLYRDLPEPPRGGPDIEALLRGNRNAVAQRIGRSFKPVEVRFLGLWDTVPGLQFTRFNDDGEQTYRGRRLDRPPYKVKPYPNIRTIAHALSIDEKRSQFRPLLVGPPLAPARTDVHEVWFPGVHSDVGGGYTDSNEMASLSLAWMIELLDGDSVIPGVYKLWLDARGGIIHHSERDFWGALGSDEVARQVPPGSAVHVSFLERLRATEPVWESDSGSEGPHRSRLYRPAIAASFWKGDSFDERAFKRSFAIVKRGRAELIEEKGAPLTIEQMTVENTRVPAAPATGGAKKRTASDPAPAQADRRAM